MFIILDISGMKYVGVILCLLMIAKTNGQDALPPAKFMGIEMRGNVDEFSGMLKKKGFQLIENTDEGQLLKGDFAGESVKVLVSGKEKVYAIGVFFHDQSEWIPLKKKYFNYKERLISKYGNPLSHSEEFSGSFVDGLEMSSIHKGEIEYYSKFEQSLTSGRIALSITKSPFEEYSGCLMLIYVDEKNLIEKQKEDNDDL